MASRGRRNVTLASAALIALLLLLATVPAGSAQTTVGAGPCALPGKGTTVYGAGPPAKLCTVPAGVTQLRVQAWGSQGGDNFHIAKSTDFGGSGGYAERTISVAPDTTLVIVGGVQGDDAGKAKEGGAGGGGSGGVYLFYPIRSTADVVVVAGGGGGAGCDDGGFGGGIWGTQASGQGQNGSSTAHCGTDERFGRGGLGHDRLRGCE